MTLDLDAIEARCNAATAGPWELGKGYGAVVSPNQPVRDVHDSFESIDAYGGLLVGESFHVADSVFVAAAREDVPALVARVRELEAETAPLRAFVKRAPAYTKHGNPCDWSCLKCDAELLLGTEGRVSDPDNVDLDLLRKLASGEGGARTGALRRAGYLTWEVTGAGLAALAGREEVG